MARVLVLREPEDGARTAAILRARGHEPLMLPLQAVCPLWPPLGQEPIGGFVATSAHAAPWLARHATGTGAPVLAVGARTAEALRSKGVSGVIEGPGRAEDLVPLAEALRAQAPLVYAAGRTRLPDLEAGLRARGVAFRTLEVYDMVDRLPADPEVDQALAGGAPDAVLILSRRQADLFETLSSRRPELRAPGPRPLCLSEAVAARLDPSRRPEWGARSTLEGLLTRLS
ncbi:uroporphyrinogen-III synthase [Aureimonas phyllosphaerae]|uniref:uroporphyrinogen-III synthase n=1 Tax=Aureimonas phyllosphaerae TaxID=1166078 RepID=UPI003A5C6B15